MASGDRVGLARPDRTRPWTCFRKPTTAGVPFGWIAADGGCGQYRDVGDGATERSLPYLPAVPSTQPLARVSGAPLVRVHGAKGERLCDWAFANY